MKRLVIVVLLLGFVSSAQASERLYGKFYAGIRKSDLADLASLHGYRLYDGTGRCACGYSIGSMLDVDKPSLFPDDIIYIKMGPPFDSRVCLHFERNRLKSITLVAMVSVSKDKYSTISDKLRVNAKKEMKYYLRDMNMNDTRVKEGKVEEETILYFDNGKIHGACFIGNYYVRESVDLISGRPSYQASVGIVIGILSGDTLNIPR